MAANIYNFPLRSDDVFVISFPKSGTTWTQELVWLLLNDLDYEKAKKSLNYRFPFLEASMFDFEEPVPEDPRYAISKEIKPPTVDQIKNMPSPKFIKSHLPLSLLPPNLLEKSKVVYVARDPRDVAVSFFHHYKLMKMMAPDRDFKTYWSYFINSKLLWTPYFASVLEAWEKRNHPNMLFLFYEELSKDLSGIIRRVANFFDKKITDVQIDELKEHLKFDNFKKNKSVNYQDMQDKGLFSNDGGFVRKGKVGGWREHFDEEMTAQAEKWINENLKGTDFRFPQ
ncbi:Retinol dehydratase [Danaus plexippus plexippus]|uniref:Retinol dehydratase n=1 Tax=Danaus plexippus plexippus TaxID=278856 RepID=A0A212FIG8_DANPL|nr:Retinol dehydratase [Danaus plexippus plexippus]